MQNMSFPEIASQAIDCLSHGRALLTVGGDKPNTMTIGWGIVGHIWGKPIFMVLVRPQRYTYHLIMEQKQFTVSMGIDNAHKEIFAFAGTESGANLDKFNGHGLTALPAQIVNAPIVGECELHFECRTLLEQDMTPDDFDKKTDAVMYPDKDYHRMIFGEIVACYRTDK